MPHMQPRTTHDYQQQQLTSALDAIRADELERSAAHTGLRVYGLDYALRLVKHFKAERPQGGQLPLFS